MAGKSDAHYKDSERAKPTSFWTKANHRVTPKQTMLQNLRYAPRVKIGVPHFALSQATI